MKELVQGKTIWSVPDVGSVTGEEKIPIGDSSSVAKTVKVKTLLDEIPLKKSVGENSVIQKTRSGAENKAISENSIAFGSLNSAGTKAYKWSTINFATNTITLVDTPSGIDSGDRLSIVNKNHYDDCCQVVSVSGKNVVVDSLPFTTVESDTGEDANTIFIVSKPSVGNKDLGQCAHAEGGNTMATQMFSHAEGYGTKAIGQYSHAEGRETEAGYAGHAEGQGTKALGQRSHAEGNETAALGTHSHAEGAKTIASGDRSHTEGQETKATMQNSHAEGGYTESNGNHSHAEGWHAVTSGGASHVEGYYTEAQNRGEHAEGNFNKSNKASDSYGNKGNTAHSVGIGTSNSARKNAFEIMQNGDVYVVGIGGYDGTNAGQSGVKTLQDIIKSMQP